MQLHFHSNSNSWILTGIWEAFSIQVCFRYTDTVTDDVVWWCFSSFSFVLCWIWLWFLLRTIWYRRISEKWLRCSDLVQTLDAKDKLGLHMLLKYIFSVCLVRAQWRELWPQDCMWRAEQLNPICLSSAAKEAICISSECISARSFCKYGSTRSSVERLLFHQSITRWKAEVTEPLLLYLSASFSLKCATWRRGNHSRWHHTRCQTCRLSSLESPLNGVTHESPSSRVILQHAL